jgi:hypothetical protein
MKLRYGRTMWQQALVASMLIAACSAALAGTGGTINFSGAIVEPTFGIAAAPGRLSDTSTTSPPSWTIEPNGTVSIAYVAAPGSWADADVSIVESGATASASRAAPLPVSMSSMGRAVYQREVDGNGRYAIGSAGGVIRLHAGPLSHTSGPTLVSVITSYQ